MSAVHYNIKVSSDGLKAIESALDVAASEFGEAQATMGATSPPVGSGAGVNNLATEILDAATHALGLAVGMLDSLADKISTTDVTYGYTESQLSVPNLVDGSAKRPLAP